MSAKPPHSSILMHDADLDHSSLVVTLRRWLKRSPEKHTVPAQAAAEDPRTFQPTSEGSGVFGEWTLDSYGLPAYEYKLDQYADVRARYPNTANLDRRDHVHQIGNDRVTGLASNDGTVQVYLGDRGGVFLNYFATRDDPPRPDVPARTGLALLAYNVVKLIVGIWAELLVWWRRLRAGKPSPAETAQSVTSEGVQPRGAIPPQAAPIAAESVSERPPEKFAYAGGFGYIECKGDVTATAFRYRKPGVEMRRIFGMGYVETQLTFHDIQVTRRVHAPAGDYPFLLVDVYYENIGTNPVDFRGYEYWDINVRQMELQWLRGEAFSDAFDNQRIDINDQFESKIEWVRAANALRFRQSDKNDSNPDDVNMIDVAPADIFLSDLSGTPDAFFVDKQRFFGTGDAAQPQTVRQCLPTMPHAQITTSMPYCMVMRRDFMLAPGEKASQRYAYGTVMPQAALDYHTPFPKGDLLADTAETWKERLPYFHTGIDATLKREMAWHAYYLQSATLYNEYFNTHVTPQGSAYLYIHGADGVPRDQSLSVLPLVYLRPDLARDNLKLIMSLMDAATGSMWYGFSGHGYVDSAIIHDKPSDLDLFFLMALNEYLSATGDLAFLDCEVPFYPVGSRVLPNGAHGRTVLDHVRCAINHLIHEVRRGEHGLIRIGDGDWSDGVVFEDCVKFGGLAALTWFDNSKMYGESIPNTQMALYVLPITQAIIQERDPEFAQAIDTFLSGLSDALHQQWNGRWYTRALLRNEFNGVVTVDSEQINLEAQPWALISRDAMARGTDKALIKSVTTQLDFASKTGAPTLENGLVWYAISQLLTWGYCRADESQLAWRSLLRNTLAVHAEIFPETWVGVWTAPDALFANTSKENPGGAWQSPATPMIDFPAMNSNPHAMSLLALLRVCGIEPSSDGKGLLIHPHVPRDQFTLDMPLLCLRVAPGCISGDYRAIVTGQRTLYVTVPEGMTTIRVRSGARSFEVEPKSQVEVPLDLVANAETHFEVTWA